MKISQRLGVFFFLIFTTVNAQQYVFKQYTVDDGLAQSQVRAIAQDEMGYLWVGTASGLSKFNGREFKNYSAKDGLADMQVNAIFNCKEGGVWVVTNKGLVKFNQKKITSVPIAELLGDDNLFDAAQDNEGGLWLAAYKKGVIYLPKGDVNNAKLFEFDDNRISSLYISANNNVYAFGGVVPLTYFDKTNNTFRPLYYNNEEIYANDILEHNGTLFIVTENEVLEVYSENKITLSKIYKNNAQGIIRNGVLDNNQNIWLATNSGVLKLDKNKKSTLFNQTNGLAFEEARAVFQDREDNIWIGTDGGGLFKFYSKQEFVTLTKRDGLPSEQIMSVIELNQEVWFSTYTEGVFVKRGEKYIQYTTPNGLADNTVWASCKDNNNNLWFGTSNGLSMYDGKKFTTYTTQDGLPSNRVTALFNDKHGNVWIGCKDGVATYKNQVFTAFLEDEGFNGYRTRSIKQSANGTIWIGAKNGVFSTTNGTTFKDEIWADSIQMYSEVYSIELYKDVVLIGTSAGLYIYNPTTKSITSIELSKKYFSNSVNFLIADKNNDGHFWAGRNDGLYFLTLQFEDNELKQYNTKRFSTYNGIENLETNQNSAYFDKNGILWFGTGKGLVRKLDATIPVNENNLEFNPFISSVLLFLEPILPSAKISIDEVSGLPQNLTLSHKQNHVTIDYESVSLSSSDAFVYRYKLIGLEGLEEEWSPPTKTTSATFSNLKHGKYEFQVQTSTIDDRSWSEPATFSFEILTPFWLTSWFIILASLSGIVLIYLIYRWRTQVNNRKRETEQVVFKNKLLALEQQSLNSSMNRHFIFNALNSIQYYINTQDRLSANKYLTSFAKLIRKNLESTNTHNNLTTLRDELERIKLYLSLEAMRFPDKVTYAIDVSQELNIDAINVPPMFFQPFIENSIWHGILPKESGHIQITIKPTGADKLQILIEDDGVGVSVSSQNRQVSHHDSRGVDITKRRIELIEKYINQTITVKGPEDILDNDEKTIGTRVEIIFPIENVTQL
jgi:ligand-binding sensor domain-containing protein/two-component sensor histidine kinase